MCETALCQTPAGTVDAAAEVTTKGMVEATTKQLGKVGAVGEEAAGAATAGPAGLSKRDP